MTESSTSLIVVGARGRMGARLCELALEDPLTRLAGAIVRSGSPSIGSSVRPERRDAPTYGDAEAATQNPAFSRGVFVDFSSVDGAMDAMNLALHHRGALLVGTTALSDSALAALRVAAERIPVLVCSNTSLGIAVVAQTISTISLALGPSYDCSIVESHHIAKKDAPSGTAKRLAAAVRQSGHALRDDQVLAMRGGDVIGEHTVRFAGPGEIIEITHRATSRDLFVRGALRAARWLGGQGAGWYTIEDSIPNAARSKHDRE